ncbi:MAG: 3D-(3,5/4)-trihydroxycyclohexane-1,2-dione acylhydrolase (decyclizing), partial [Acidobacteriota bacterium]
RLTMAQALVRFIAAQRTVWQGQEVPLFGGVWAIFGHGNVAGVGEALYRHRDALPTYRAHNEQAMAHTAIAYSKAHMRRRMMACTTSIGPGATNMVTAAALAHVNRLPVLLLPGDIFSSRAPDPVLQQVEDFHDATVSANDCFKPVSRYFDRIMHPGELLTALPRAIRVLTDPALCGPVTLALPQDVQTMAFAYPESFFAPETILFAAPPPDEAALARAAALLRAAKQPLIIAGGGILYALAREADLVLAIGTRLQDFMTGSHSLFPKAKLISLNVNAFDALKWHATELVGDAGAGLAALSRALETWRSDAAWEADAKKRADGWRSDIARITGRRDVALPYEGEVIGAVQRSAVDSPKDDIVVCAAGTLPGDLHKLWRTGVPGGYHVEYGYSCMGYEIAGGLGVKMAHPEREAVVIVGDGSYLMLNSEIATSLLLDQKLVIVLLDNHGFGCIHRLQQACGGAPFNNLFPDTVQGANGAPKIDFAAHAAALGAVAENVQTIPELEAALKRARASERTYLVCIETDPNRTTEEGGWWWEVAVPEVSEREAVRKARAAYEEGKKKQRP